MRAVIAAVLFAGAVQPGERIVLVEGEKREIDVRIVKGS